MCITSERHIGELGARCLSTLERGQDSRQQSLFKVAAIDRVNEGIAQAYLNECLMSEPSDSLAVF